MVLEISYTPPAALESFIAAPPWACAGRHPGLRHHTNLLKETPMSIKPEEKARLMKEFAIKEGDTGSPEVQVLSLIHI